MHLARWIEQLVRQGEDLGKIAAAVEITVGQLMPPAPEPASEIGRGR